RLERPEWRPSFRRRPFVEGRATRVFGAGALAEGFRWRALRPSGPARDRLLRVQRGASGRRGVSDALELARAAGNPRSRSLALGELRLVAWEFDRDYEKALALFEEAIDLARNLGLTGLQITWLNNSAGALRDSGRLAEALERYLEAVRLEERTGQRRERPHLLNNIGQVLSMSARPEAAEGYLLEALALAERQNVPTIRWMARMELGQVYRDVDPARGSVLRGGSGRTRGLAGLGADGALPRGRAGPRPLPVRRVRSLHRLPAGARA
ncbi:MAG: tetratricopeptide repeat protein, partial [Acidobacteriota bacterium]|nr:tetratricopeptide repeat protein [Acidobacteriota bacterium]